MSIILIRVEALLSKAGVILPRAFLASFVGASFLLLVALHAGSLAEWGGTVLLHRWYPLAWLLTCVPAVIADPTRADGKFSATLHGALLALALCLAFFFLGTCDLLARDDRAFWALVLPLVFVLLSRLFLADLLLRFLIGKACSRRVIRSQLLSLYCRMLQVTPADVGAAPTSAALVALSNLRLRALRILGLRLTRSLPLELALASRADAELRSLRADPSPDHFDKALAAVTDEARLQLALTRSSLPACGNATVQRWSSRWAYLWAELRRGSLRLELRAYAARQNMDQLMDLVRTLAIASSNEQPLLSEINSACAAGRNARFSQIRPLWTRWGDAVERSGRSLSLVHCGIVIGETLALSSPEEFLVRRASLDRSVVLPPMASDLLTVLACRELLTIGGLSETEEHPVLVNLMRSARRSGIVPADFSSPPWQKWGLVDPVKWADIELGALPQALLDSSPTLVFVNPGPGRISVGLPLVGLMVVGILAALHLRSTPRVPHQKRFVEVQASRPKMDGKPALSIDLDNDGGRIYAAMDGAGVVTVDIRDYSTRRVQGLSSQVIQDVVALKAGGFIALTQGRDGSLGLDQVGVDGALASVPIGLPEADVGQVLAAERSINHAREVGEDILLALGQELLLYKTNGRVLKRVGLPSEAMRESKILDVAASRRIPGRAWLLLAQGGKRQVVQLGLDKPEAPVFEPFDGADLLGQPERLCHDGNRLWCLDSRGNLYERADQGWKPRSGSPIQAAEAGGLRTASRLAVSNLGTGAPGVLWMLKGGALFARAIPADEAAARLPRPWKKVDLSLDDTPDGEFLGEIFAYSDGLKAMLLVPFRNGIKAVTFSEQEEPKSEPWVNPKDGYSILHADGGPEGLTICLGIKGAGFSGTQVRFLPSADFAAARSKTIDVIGTVVQGSLAKSDDYRFDSIVGSAQMSGVTHHIDKQGRLLSFTTRRLTPRGLPTEMEVINGLYADGQGTLPLPWRSPGTDFEVLSAVQSGRDGESLLVSTTSGLAQLNIGSGGVLDSATALIEQDGVGPDAAHTPLAVTLADERPEIFFLTRQDGQDSRPLAEPWQVSGRSPAPAMDWKLGQAAYGGESAGNKVNFLADSLHRLRLPGTEIQSRGPLVAIAPDRRLIWRNSPDALWLKGQAGATRWSDLGHSPNGLTMVRGRNADEDTATVSAIAVLGLSNLSQLVPTVLWDEGTKPYQTPFLEFAIARSDSQLVCPTPSTFTAYNWANRKWEVQSQWGDSPAPQESLRLMAEYDEIGFARRAWWWSVDGKCWGIGADGARVGHRINGTIVKAEWHGDVAFFLTELNGVHMASLGNFTRTILGNETQKSPVVSVRQMVFGDTMLAALGGDGCAYSLESDSGLFRKSGGKLERLLEVGGAIVARTLDGSLLLPLTDGESRREKVVDVLSLGSLGAAKERDGNIVLFGRNLDEFVSIGTTRPNSPRIGPRINSLLEHDGGLFLAGDDGILFRPAPKVGMLPIMLTSASGKSAGVDWLAQLEGAPIAFRFDDDRLRLFKIGAVNGNQHGLIAYPLRLVSPDSSITYLADEQPEIKPEAGAAGDRLGGKGRLEKDSLMAPLGSFVLHISGNERGSKSPYCYNPARGTEDLLTVTARLSSHRGLSNDAFIVPTGSGRNETLLIRDGSRLYQARSDGGSPPISVEMIEDEVLDVMHAGAGKGVRLRRGRDSTTLLANDSSEVPLPKFQLSTSASSLTERILPVPGSAGKLIALIDGAMVRVDANGIDPIEPIVPGVKFRDIGSAGSRIYAARDSGDGTQEVRFVSGDKKPIPNITSLAVARDNLAYRTTNGNTHTFVSHLRDDQATARESRRISSTPGLDLRADLGRSVKVGDSLYFISSGKLSIYDGAMGAWTTIDLQLGPDCEFRQKDGVCYVVSTANGNGTKVEGGPIGSYEVGLALLPNIGGQPLTLSSSPEAFGIVAGLTRVESDLDKLEPVLSDLRDFSSDWQDFEDGSVLVPSISDRRKVYVVFARDGGLVTRGLELPFDVSQSLVLKVSPNELMFSQPFDFDPIGVIVRSDGMASSVNLKEPEQFPVQADLAGFSSAHAGWVRIPDSFGEFAHRLSGRKSFEVPRDGSRVRYSDGTWHVEVIGLEKVRPSEPRTREREVQLGSPRLVNRIDPSFEAATDFHKPLGTGRGIDITIGGKLFRDWHNSRAISSDMPAAIDEVKSMGVDDEGNLFVIDATGDVWLRRVSDLSRRSHIGKVEPGSRFFLLGSDSRDTNPKLVISSGRLTHRVEVAGLAPIEADREFLWDSIAEASREIGGLSCNGRRGGGFSFLNPHGLELGLSLQGWHVAGAADLPYDLVAHAAHGPMVRLRGGRFNGLQGEGYLRVDQPTTLAAIQPLRPSEIKDRPRPVPFKVASLTFTPSDSGEWSLRSDNGHQHRFHRDGGLAVDRLERVSTLAAAGKVHLVHSPGERGEIYYREWSRAGLGDPVVLKNPYGSDNPKEIFTYSGELYVVFGSKTSKWARLEVSGAQPVLQPIESKLEKWALGAGSVADSRWVLRQGGRLEQSDGRGGWDEMPYATEDGFRLACDDPAWGADSLRSDGTGGVIYRSAQSRNDRGDFWYHRAKGVAEPRRWKDSLPGPYEPKSQLRLGPVSFDLASPNEYTLGVDGEKHAFKLEVGDGLRLPHARPSAGASFIVQPTGLLLPTARTSDGRQLHALFEPATPAPLYTLAPPMQVPPRTVPARERAVVINGEGLLLGWEATGSLFLESPEGLRFQLGRANQAAPLASDAAATVRPLRVTTEEVAFTTVEGGEVALRLPRSHLGDLRKASLDRLDVAQAGLDIFARRSPEVALRQQEIHAIDASGNPVASSAHPSVELAGPKDCVLRMPTTSHDIPLHVPAGKQSWSLPMDDVVAAHRFASGDYLVQSMGGRWLASYGEDRALRKSLLLASPDMASARLHTQPGTWVAHLRLAERSLRVDPSLELASPEKPLDVSFTVAPGVTLALKSPHTYSILADGAPVDCKGDRAYPGARIQAAYAKGTTFFDLRDTYGSRLSRDGEYQLPEARPRRLIRVFGELTEDGVGSASCASWTIFADGKSYAASSDGRSLLDDDGVPFVDRLRGFDAIDGELAIDAGSHAVRLGGARVLAAFDRAEPLQRVLPIRYVRQDDALKPDAIEVQGFPTRLIAASDGSAVVSASAYHVSYADIATRGISFVRLLGGGDIQLRMRRSIDPQGVRYLYQSDSVFSGSQLAVDRVNRVETRNGRIHLRHEPDAAGVVPLIPTGWSGIRRRDGPQQAVDTPRSLLHPWSEPRRWIIEHGELHWLETSYRWGD